MRHRTVITLEDNTRHGGMGAAITRALSDAGSRIPVRTLGVPGMFIPQAPAAACSPRQAWTRTASPEQFLALEPNTLTSQVQEAYGDPDQSRTARPR
ncbi:transketolase C-terminal domain-containing protein [Streptomyces ficellus]|uniref:transketolase C-terminal domain-containing protein n=1 Tax=Streptomyces ficellus TaxID=1977088 RepID=UPI00338E3E7A